MLRKIESKNIKEYEIWGLDCENDSETGQFKLGVIWRDECDYTVFDNPEDMANYMYKPHSVIITGLNIGYDLNLLHPYFRPYRLERTGKLITCDMQKDVSGKIIHDRTHNHRNRYVKIMDIGNFIQGKSLKQISNDFGLEHIDIHYWKNPRIKEACVSHARAGALVLRKLQSMFNKMGGELQLTGSSTALNLFQRQFLDHSHEIKDYSPDTDIMKRYANASYYGGRTEIFYRGAANKVKCIDIVSSYPAVMKDKIYPDMNTMRFIQEPAKNYPIERAINQFEGCATVTVFHPEMKIPVLPLKKNGKLFFPTGKFTGTWTFAELRYALLEGVKILKTQDVIIGKGTAGLFTKYIDAMFKFKQQKETKPAAKLAMNGLSGKFGQKEQNDAEYLEVEQGEEINVDDIYELNGIKYTYKPKDEFLSFSKKAYPVIVAYVTSYARINLREQMKHIGFEHVLYCDTDSIIYRDIGQTICNEGNQLGQWEIKFKGKWEGKTLKNYRYLETDKTYWQYVSKGIPANLQEEFWKNNETWQLTPVKLRTALRRKKVLGQWGAIKKVQGNYEDKRIFDSKGNSEPLVLM